MDSKRTPTILTIAGSDPSGGAGIQVDIKTIHALGGYALSAITSLTAQNSTGVIDSYVVPEKIFALQLEALLDDVQIDAIKIGMLGSAQTIEALAKIVSKYNCKNIVIDPIIKSSSGKTLITDDAISAMKQTLFPLAKIITPNIPEFERIFDIDTNGIDINDLDSKKLLKKIKAEYILLKGGHSSDSAHSTDHLISRDNIQSFSSPRIQTDHTHGTGCILSSAIATNLAKGFCIEESIRLSKQFLYKQMQKGYPHLNYLKPEQKRALNIL